MISRDCHGDIWLPLQKLFIKIPRRIRGHGQHLHCFSNKEKKGDTITISPTLSEFTEIEIKYLLANVCPSS